MIATLKRHLRESNLPIGVKRSNLMKIPSSDYIYGYKPKPDLEGAGKRKFIFKI